MIGIVLIAHRPLASALASSAAHVYGCAPEIATSQLAVLDVVPGVDLQVTLAEARLRVDSVDSGHGVLVLTDALGATPGNVAAQLAEAGRVAVVAGVNLPMLLRTLCYRGDSLADGVDKALAGGVQGVVRVDPSPNPQNRSPANDQSQLHHQ